MKRSEERDYYGRLFQCRGPDTNSSLPQTRENSPPFGMDPLLATGYPGGREAYLEDRLQAAYGFEGNSDRRALTFTSHGQMLTASKLPEEWAH